MNLVSLAQKMAESAQWVVEYDPEMCVYSRDKFAGCHDCANICPSEAIQYSTPPTFDAEQCVRCRACLPACHYGAYTYSGPGMVPALLNAAAEMRVRRCEIICELNSNPERGAPDVACALRIRGCIAGLGTSDFLALLNQGFDYAAIRVDACETCAWANHYPAILTRIEAARQLLSVWDKQEALVAIAGSDCATAERPVWNADAPPLSRRAFVKPPAGKRRSIEELEKEETNPFRQRLRLLQAVGAFAPDFNQAYAAFEMGRYFFALVQAGDACDACGTCARACPSGALEMVIAEQHFDLSFSPQLCVGCDICRNVCAPQAITIDHNPTYTEIFGVGQAISLARGEVKECARCRKLFAVEGDEKLCRLCRYRAQNPFGVNLPPALAERLKHRFATENNVDPARDSSKPKQEGYES